MLGRLSRFCLTSVRSVLRSSARAYGELQTLSPLVQKLKSELTEETSNYQPDAALAAFINESHFKLVESPDSVVVKLTKSKLGTDIEVYFQARAPFSPDEGEKEQTEGQGDEAAGDFNYVDFSVVIRKKDQKSGLIIECASMNGELQILHVVYSDDVQNAKRETLEVHSKDFRGPDFSTLDEKVQKGFLEYLKFLGVNEDMVSFLETFSADKEQRLYLKWLEDMQGVVVTR